MRTLLFDFDGTIGDSFEVVTEAFYELTGHERINDQAEIKRLRHLPVIKVMKELHVQPLQLPRLLMKGRKVMSEHMHEVTLFDGMREALEQLHKDGNEMYIMSSNSTQNVQKFLDANRLDTYFTKVYGGIGLFNKAAAIRKVMRHNRAAPSEYIYIGDEVRDIEGAHKAGVAVISVGWGYNDAALLASREPDALIMHAKELPETVKKI